MADSNDKIDIALGLAHFAAAASATVIAALHRGKPVDDKMVKHLLSTLATAAAESPEEAAGYFRSIAELLSGSHYEGG